MSTPYKLGAERHESIYANKIAARYLPRSKPQEQPTAVITGGQPGSGKSSLTALAVNQFRDSGYVLVDADKLRPFHPDYRRLMRTDDRNAANLTHADCGPWANRLLRDGVEGRRNIIIDQTSRDPEALAKMTVGLRQAGYRVELHVMAVAAAVSEQRIHERYEGQKEASGFGRFSTKDKHDEAYAGVHATVGAAERGNLVDRLVLYDKSAQPIYENRLENGAWRSAPGADQAMKAERTRPMTLQERREYAAGFDALADKLARPERKATPEEVGRIAEMQRNARSLLAAEVFRQEKPEAAMRQFPELATAYANVRAIEAKTNSERLTAQQRETVMARVRENVAASIERGDAAKVVRAEPERVSHRSQERDLER